jgi:hypothetical protein
MTGQSGPGAPRTRDQTMMRNTGLMVLAFLSLFVLAFALTEFGFGLADSTRIEIVGLMFAGWFVFAVFYATFLTLRWRRTMDSAEPTSK